MNPPIRYRLLRDGTRWDTDDRSKLSLREDGSVTLATLPAPARGETLELTQGAAALSGIAVDQCGRISLSNGDASSLILLVPSCSFRYTLDVQAPTGLATSDDTLYVADPERACVRLLTLPGLELRAYRSAGLHEPTAVAVDLQKRLYVVDRGTGRVVRFLERGTPDALFNNALALQFANRQPWGVAISPRLGVLVSDRFTNAVFVFGFDGSLRARLPLPSAVLPRALTCNATRVFVADDTSGAILVFDATSDNPQAPYLGEIPDFRGKVTAMTCDSSGDLYVKLGTDDRYAVFKAEAGCSRSGVLVSERLDAGIECSWERAVVRAEVPAGTKIALETFASDDANAVPGQWRPSPSLDCLINPDPSPAPQALSAFRYLWIRVTLNSSDGRVSPLVSQVEAQTIRRSYMEDLPAIYRRDDRQTRFLERWLGLFQSDMQDLERQLDEMPTHFDTQTAPAAELDWIADLLGFTSPAGATQTALRSLLARIPELYAERGTLKGLRDWAEIYSGIRPRIVEAWPARRIWTLGESSMLGFDTMLPAGNPDGLIVPGVPVTDPAYAGLRRDEYGGSNFDWYLSSTTDRMLDVSLSPARKDGANQEIGVGTLRWSGQIKPRYRERYTFSLAIWGSGDVRVRFWIDGRSWIDKWQQSAVATQGIEEDVAVVLEEDRWYPVRLDIRTTASQLSMKLMWLSRSQQREVIPPECLYSVLDEHADMSVTEDTAFKIGSAVVGESGPLTPSSFGEPLFSDYAHLFTVMAPAGCDCNADRRVKLRAVIDAEKPAHTDYHLCFVQPRMRVGFQARLGIDAFVGNGPAPMRLGEQPLNRGSYLAELSGKEGRVGDRAHVGRDLIVG